MCCDSGTSAQGHTELQTETKQKGRKTRPPRETAAECRRVQAASVKKTQEFTNCLSVMICKRTIEKSSKWSQLVQTGPLVWAPSAVPKSAVKACSYYYVEGWVMQSRPLVVCQCASCNTCTAQLLCQVAGSNLSSTASGPGHRSAAAFLCPIPGHRFKGHLCSNF